MSNNKTLIQKLRYPLDKICSIDDKVIQRLEFSFKVIYLLELLLAFNSLIAGAAIISIFNYFLVGFGAVLLLLRVIG